MWGRRVLALVSLARRDDADLAPRPFLRYVVSSTWAPHCAGRHFWALRELSGARGSLGENPPFAGRVATPEGAAPQRAHQRAFGATPMPCRRLVPLRIIYVTRSTIVARPSSGLSLGMLLAAPRHRADGNQGGRIWRMRCPSLTTCLWLAARAGPTCSTAKCVLLSARKATRPGMSTLSNQCGASGDAGARAHTWGSTGKRNCHEREARRGAKKHGKTRETL